MNHEYNICLGIYVTYLIFLEDFRDKVMKNILKNISNHMKINMIKLNKVHHFSNCVGPDMFFMVIYFFEEFNFRKMFG